MNVATITKDNKERWMNFWWVNHSKSYKKELEGGYIWCPQVRPGHVQRIPWLNVAKVRPGDVIISYAKQHVQAIGIALHAAIDSSPKPGYAEMGWDVPGWEVSVRWERLPMPFSLQPYMDTIRTFLAPRNAPLLPNGNAQLAYLSAISNEFGRWVLGNVETNEALIVGVSADAELEAQAIPATEKARLYQARIGQGAYRREVLKLEPKCRLTGVSDPGFLVASHIKPWRHSSHAERLDGHNGLMLAPHVDRLFDQGWISFQNNGDLLVREAALATLRAWGLPERENVGAFSAQTAEYLQFHREMVFRAERVD
ncbi:HNH endonuclease [Achromobacter ruhlandii]|uniref:HNH endonuclease n=3 Tax=Achromobacter ruhlandii TaxID=72557 RepID=UPI0009BE42A3|nr:HNH endonuclease [Achromobacter ruhlandii]AVC42597.1 HNH endonuclease [Achromobacter xylosoxidans]